MEKKKFIQSETKCIIKIAKYDKLKSNLLFVTHVKRYVHFMLCFMYAMCDVSVLVACYVSLFSVRCFGV